jgi:hypothetical protein
MTTALKKNLIGVHSVVIRDYQTAANQLMFKVIESAKLDLAEKTVTLKGGEAVDAYGAAIVDSNGKLTLTVKEFSEVALAAAFHNAVTHTAAEASGAVGAITNITGTSIVSATTGIASVAATTSGSGKEGTFDVVYASATTVDVYASGDVDGIVLANEETGLVQAGISITTGGTPACAAIGVTFTGGSGTIAFTAGNRARFVIRRANTGYADVYMGGGESTKGYKEVFLVFGENQERDLAYMQFYKCVVARAAISPTVKDYHSLELEITPVKDPSHSGYIGTFHRTDNT